VQALFVNRVVIPSIVASAVTVWGEDLLPRIALPPIRRLDVCKAFFGLFSQAWTAAALFPALPHATRFAMGAMKRSVRAALPAEPHAQAVAVAKGRLSGVFWLRHRLSPGNCAVASADGVG
jgi:hypothetical protein